MHWGLKFNIFSFSKGASLMPLMENPSTPDWKSAVFWQVGYVVCNLVTLCVTWKTTLCAAVDSSYIMLIMVIAIIFSL